MHAHVHTHTHDTATTTATKKTRGKPRQQTNSCHICVCVGFPRSLEQAALLDGCQRIDFVLHIDVPFDTIVERLAARLCHMPSGRIYNLHYNPPKVAGLDDETGEPLDVREDDKPETIRARLQLYEDETKPLLDHYDAKGLLKTFTGTESDVIYPMVADYMSNNLKISSL